MLHFIYKTTRKFDKKFYIGRRSTKNINDGYLGSGTYIKNSIDKYGIDNHNREILEFLPSLEDLVRRESEIITPTLLADPMCMNIIEGGETWGSIGASAAATLGNYSLKRDHKAIAEKSRVTKLKRGTQYHPPSDAWITSGAIKNAAKPEANAKRRATMKVRGHSIGNKNSQFGVKRVGINKDGKIKKVLPEQLQEFLCAGWTKGFKQA